MKFLFTFLTILLIYINSNAQISQQWATRYNEPNNYYEWGSQCAVDKLGNVYVTGWGYSGSDDTSYCCITLKYNSSGVQQWVVIYNGPAHDADQGRGIALDSAGNVYVAGVATISGTTYDVLLIKYNPNGVQQWLQTYNGTGNGDDWANSISLDASGNIYLSGGTTRTGTGNDFLALKYNSSGVLQWVGTYNGTGNGSDYANALAIDKFGNSYLTGTSKGTTLYGDYATVKFNSSGVLQWSARYNGPGNDLDQGSGICADTNGNVYMTGYTFGSGTATDITTIKYNSSGAQQWVQTYDGTAVNYDQAHGIALDSSGNIIVVGYSSGIGSNYDGIIIKYSPSGVQQWVARYNGPANGLDELSSVAIDKYNNIYVTGQTDVNNFVSWDYVTMKYNPEGAQQWLIRYNGPASSTDQATYITLDGSNSVYVTGMSWGTTTTKWDIATVKYSQPTSITTLSNEIPDKFSLSQNYPNPFNPSTIINYQLTINSNVILKVYNNLGNEVEVLVNEKQNAGSYSVTFNGGNLPSGIYFYKLEAGEFKETKKMILIK
ncbi:MAG: SBBP repeat-containing protein [Ignavibacteria bacterium]|nr:SBBP repeat-containing protein [Ignavibacteria bacterium]